jgi:hypothetical protein
MKEPITWWRANEVRDIAEGLMPEFHEHLADLRILYLFRSKHSEKKGRSTLGTCRKIGGLTAYLAFRTELEAITAERPPAPVADSFFVVEIAHDTWVHLSPSQRIALVDHELSHIGADAEMVGHDVEEFAAVIQRHGAWKTDLSAFLEASNQQHLFNDPQRVNDHTDQVQ